MVSTTYLIKNMFETYGGDKKEASKPKPKPKPKSAPIEVPIDAPEVERTGPIKVPVETPPFTPNRRGNFR